MKTLADFKRRVRVGCKLLCVENTYRPVLNGTVRTVTRCQTVGFKWRNAGADKDSHSAYPRATEFTVVDADTVRYKLWPNMEYTVCLRFIEEVSDV